LLILPHPISTKLDNFQKLPLTLILIALAILLGRGGIQKRPITFIDAKIMEKPLTDQMVLNTPFTLIKSMEDRLIQKVHYFSSDQMLSFLNLRKDSLVRHLPPHLGSKPNVVILILEGLSSEYLSELTTPFFLKLSKQGVLYNPAFANGRRSIEGISSVVTSIPALMDDPFILSQFGMNDFVSLGKILKQQNYETSFFHGAKNGSMHFDVFTRAAGFDHYYGKNEFGDLSQDDGAWGIFDDPFLQYSCKTMSGFNKNFLSVIFTLTSHHPFPLPTEFKKQMDSSPLKDQEPVLKTIRYVDSALEHFFECARQQAWYQNTLFVLVADHAGPVTIKKDKTFEELFEIPLLFYSPNSTWTQDLSRDVVAQQIDILPTIIDFLGLNLPTENHLSRSLFIGGEKNIILYSGHHYETLTKPQQKTKAELEAIQKASLQYFTEGLYQNRIFYPKP
jgi:phosphoglycerol transferase MdoB-like AlkP superfamily enzyme